MGLGFYQELGREEGGSIGRGGVLDQERDQGRYQVEDQGQDVGREEEEDWDKVWVWDFISSWEGRKVDKVLRKGRGRRSE